ncbi:hypothetical protein H8Z75_23195 (plasmid) [Xanthomonas citri pv. citri]|nr:hypothetical protein H8Z75_23195 [Xanthomonas citri pv. citri]
MKDYRLEVASSFIHPMWLRTVAGREFEVVVANDGGLEVEGNVSASSATPCPRVRPWCCVSAAGSRA